MAQEIAPGKQAEVAPLDLESPAVFELSTGRSKVEIHATPDGVIRLTNSSVEVDVVAQGSEGNRASLRLPSGASISIWPVERALVTAGKLQFSIDVTAAGWAFVIRADRVGRRGLAVTCDGVSSRLYDRQRLDLDREAGRIVFRITGKRYPGAIVEKSPAKDTATTQPVVTIGAPPAGEGADSAAPGVFPSEGRDFTGQTIPLPVLSWEVFRPPDVSR